MIVVSVRKSHIKRVCDKVAGKDYGQMQAGVVCIDLLMWPASFHLDKPGRRLGAKTTAHFWAL